MQDRGVTQEQLSIRSGVPKATIHRWLTGKSIRPYHRLGLLNLAAALELPRISTNRLLVAAGFAPLHDDQHVSDAEEAELIARWQPGTRTDLPAPLTPFVGRAREVDDIGELLSRPAVRLLTLVGPGGCGKTRLAIRVAGELVDVYPDGVFFVPFAPVTEPGRVTQTIAEYLGLSDVVDDLLDQRLVKWLHARRCLLVLDNLEHLLESGADIGRLLRGAPELSVLATSRIALHMSGEHVWPVEPFDLPSPHAPVDVLRDSPAIVLFRQSAEAVHSGRTLGDDDLEAVAQICIRLDGLPLAIELAAGQLRGAAPQKLLAEFPSRLGLASDGPRDVHYRHRTLRDTIAWSVDLLSEPARALFTALTVFVGGWTLDAANNLAELIFDCSTFDARQLLDDLRDANLIERMTFPDGSTRFRMLETIREFGIERRHAQGNDAALRDRHADYFLDLAESAPPYVPQTRSNAWYRLVDTDLDNIRAALDWVSNAMEDQRLGRFAASLWPYWHEYMRVVEGRRWLKLAVAGKVSLPSRLRASVLTGACTLSMTRSGFDLGRAYGEGALQICEEIGDSRNAALATQQLGWMNYMLGQVEEAIRQFQSSLGYWRMTGDRLGYAFSLSDLALVAITVGGIGPAETYLREAEAICIEARDNQGLARVRRDRALNALLS